MMTGRKRGDVLPYNQFDLDGDLKMAEYFLRGTPLSRVAVAGLVERLATAAKVLPECRKVCDELLHEDRSADNLTSYTRDLVVAVVEKLPAPAPRPSSNGA